MSHDCRAAGGTELWSRWVLIPEPCGHSPAGCRTASHGSPWLARTEHGHWFPSASKPGVISVLLLFTWHEGVQTWWKRKLANLLQSKLTRLLSCIFQFQMYHLLLFSLAHTCPGRARGIVTFLKPGRGKKSYRDLELCLMLRILIWLEKQCV